MTLTYPELHRARDLLWVVTGEEKVGALRKLLARDPVDSRRPGGAGGRLRDPHRPSCRCGRL